MKTNRGKEPQIVSKYKISSVFFLEKGSPELNKFRSTVMEWLRRTALRTLNLNRCLITVENEILSYCNLFAGDELES